MNKKILLIEDEVNVVGFIKKGLTEEGFEVSVALDGNSGVNMAVKNNYDLMGNLNELQHMGDSNFTRIYYHTNNLLDAFEVDGQTYHYQYDVCGNQIQENEERHMQWDYADKLRLYYNQTSSGSEPSVYTHYLYDAGGNRVKKYTRTAGGNWETITYIDGIIEYREDQDSNIQSISHVMDDSKRIATIREGFDFGDTTPAIKYNLDDHLGSSNVLVDENGTLVNFEEYYPFGETSFGSYAKKRYRFCGKEKDSESGMYYYGARYYSPWLCRFISVDPLAGKYVFQSAYTYADNNPVNYNDPTGMGSEPVNQTAQTDNNNQRAESKNSEVGTSSNGPPEKTLWRKIRLFVDNIFGDGKIFIKSDEGPKIPMYKHTIKLERNNTIDLGHGMGGQLGRYTGKQTETSSSTPPQRMNDPVMVEPRFLTKLPSPELTPPTLQPINTNIIRQRPSNFTPPNPRTIPGVNYADSTPTDRQINASRIAGRDLSRNPNYRVAIQAVLYFNAVNPNNASEVSTALNKPSVESNSKSPSFRAIGLNQSNAMRRIMITNGASNSQVIVLQPRVTNNVMNSGIRITFIRTP